MAVYVEIFIRAPMETLWDHTQKPELHERWDLRFSRIRYLAKTNEDDPQRFLYATRIGFGLEVTGEGESVGERNLMDGSRTSALKFSSADPRSIILEGSGYWKYIPSANGIRFLTWYDYRTRFGLLGFIFDRLVFRPLIGWATAWSFDRVRLWIERGLDPSIVLRQWLVHAAARFSLAFIFLYHGLVPKLFGPHPDELAMIREAGVSAERAGAVTTIVGIGEVLLSFALILLWRRRWPPWLCRGLMAVAAVGVAINSPRFLVAPFNPVTLNLAVGCLAAIDLIVLDGIPSAARCLRKPRPGPA